MTSLKGWYLKSISSESNEGITWNDAKQLWNMPSDDTVEIYRYVYELDLTKGAIKHGESLDEYDWIQYDTHSTDFRLYPSRGYFLYIMKWDQ